MRSDRAREPIEDLRAESEARFDDLREQRVLAAIRARRVERPRPVSRRPRIALVAAIAIAIAVAIAGHSSNRPA
jgi:hypothetical protein